MAVLDVLAGVGVLVLGAIWREVAASRRAQERAEGWLRYMAKPPAGGALPD